MTSRVKAKALAKVPIVGGVNIVLYAPAVFDAVSKKDTKTLVAVAKKWLGGTQPASDAERCELIESCFVAGTQFLAANRASSAHKLFDLAITHLANAHDYYFKYFADAADKLDHGTSGLTKAEAHHLAKGIRAALNLVIESEEGEEEAEPAEAAEKTPETSAEKAESERIATAKTGPQAPVSAARKGAKGSTDGETAEAVAAAKPAEAEDEEPVEAVEAAEELDAAEEAEAIETGEEDEDETDDTAVELPVAAESADGADQDEIHDGHTQSEVIEEESADAEDDAEDAEDADSDDDANDSGDDGDDGDGDDTDEAVVEQILSEPVGKKTGASKSTPSAFADDADDDDSDDGHGDDGDDGSADEAEVANVAEKSPADDDDAAADEDEDEDEDEEADAKDAEEAEEEAEAEDAEADADEETVEPADSDAGKPAEEDEEEPDAEAADEDEDPAEEVHDLDAEGKPADDGNLEMAFEGIEMDDDDEREATRILPASEKSEEDEAEAEAEAEEKERSEFDFPDRSEEARFYRLTTAPRVSVLNQTQDIWMDVLILHVPRVNDLIEAGKRKRVTKIAIRQFRSEWKAHRRALIRDLSGDAALQFHDILVQTGCRFIEGVKVAASTTLSQGMLSEGESFMAEGELDNAIKAFRTFLMHDPCDDVVWYNLGCCYEAIEDFAEARRAFDACLAVNPTDPDYFLHAGQTAVAENRRLRGHVFLSRAFMLDPELSGVREKLEEFDGPLAEQDIEREEIHFDRELFRSMDQWPALRKSDARGTEPAMDAGLPKLLALYQAERFGAACGQAEELVAQQRMANAALLGASAYLGLASATPDMGLALPLLRRSAELAAVAEREKTELLAGWRSNLEQIRGRLKRAAEIYKLPSEGGFSTLAKAFHQAIGSEVSLMPGEVSGTGPKPKPKIRDTANRGSDRPAAGAGPAGGAGTAGGAAGPSAPKPVSTTGPKAPVAGAKPAGSDGKPGTPRSTRATGAKGPIGTGGGGSKSGSSSTRRKP